MRKSYRSGLSLVLLVGAAACAPADGPLSEQDLERWLAAYGAAWEAKDADAVTAIFTADALYQETPYADPFVGREGIGEYWSSVTADQADIDFDFGIISVSDTTGIASWSSRFRSISGDVPVELNGVFVLEFADADHVSSLREWWHVR